MVSLIIEPDKTHKALTMQRSVNERRCCHSFRFNEQVKSRSNWRIIAAIVPVFVSLAGLGRRAISPMADVSTGCLSDVGHRLFSGLFPLVLVLGRPGPVTPDPAHRAPATSNQLQFSVCSN